MKTVPLVAGTKIACVKGWNEPGFQWDEEEVRFGNLGIITGAVSGITVVDFDNLKLKKEIVSNDEVALYKELWDTIAPLCSVIVKTQNDGYHLYFGYDQRLSQTQGLITGVDVRNDKGSDSIINLHQGRSQHGVLHQNYLTDPNRAVRLCRPFIAKMFENLPTLSLVQ